MPIVETKVSQGDPCIEYSEEPTTPGRYPLLKHNGTLKGCKSSIDGDYYSDGRYEKIDQEDEATFFKDNQIYMDLISLPLSQVELTSSNYFYGFYTRNTIPLDLSCEYSSHHLNRHKFVDIGKTMS